VTDAREDLNFLRPSAADAAGYGPDSEDLGPADWHAAAAAAAEHTGGIGTKCYAVPEVFSQPGRARAPPSAP
jgi:hypothetical protein